MPETLLRPERTRHEQLIDEIARRYYDTTTEAAEVLDGVMRTEIPLGYDGYDVYSCKDGTRFGEMSRNSLEAAYEVACKHSNLSFEVDRRRLEAEEIEILQAMARGETPNTMVVISDFPEQLMDCQDDVGGYNVTR